MSSFPRIPINPRLTFGESIEKVCMRGRLHPGLKELFTKAYFSAHQNECLFYDDGDSEENERSSPGAWIVTILKFAQGDVSVRLSLKRRLETGRWLMPLQVPPAAPLWLIRHFLGRLQTPLLFCLTTGPRDLDTFKNRWILLSKDCHAAMYCHTFNQKSHVLIQTKIAQAMEEMQLEACLTLISLITLIRNLAYEPASGWIDGHAVKALVDYFVPALISRPYRPGYLTKEDKGCRNALCYLCYNLPEIQAFCKRPATLNNVHLIFDSSSGSSILELHKNKITSPAVKKVISEVSKTPLLKTASPDSENIQQAPFLMSKNLCTPKKSSEDCKKQELQEECMVVSSPTLMETSDVEEGKGAPTECQLFNGISEEKEIVTKIKYIENIINEDSCVALPFEDKELANTSIVDAMEYTGGNEKNSTEYNPVKKCQAVKLAYKLRGQWLAWRLAGLFLDGAAFPVSGFGYTKLPHDASSSVNQ